jgi:hypothetical protein
MATADAAKPAWKSRIIGVCLLLFGGAWLVGSLIAWSNEFPSDPPEPLGVARVVRLDSFPPKSNSRRPSLVMCFPVFEYLDPPNTRRELNGTGSFKGYFKIGDEVKIGRTQQRVLVLDAFFRSQDHMWSIFLASLTMIFGRFVLWLNRTKPMSAH